MADLFGFSVPTIFATSFVVALSGAAVPGPVLAVVIGETVRRGFWAGPAIVLGHGLLELLAVALVAVGVAAIDPGGGAVAVISVLGAVVLVWVALGLYRTAHAAGGLGVAADRVDPRGHVGGLVVAGAIVSVANPYWSLWWLTVGATYVLWSMEAAAVGLASFYVGHVLGDLVWYSGVSGLVSRGRRYLNTRVLSAVLTGCAAFLVALAIAFLVGAVRTFA